MSTDTSYVLGLDGLPLGTSVALASGGEVTSTFTVADETGRAWPLELRVQHAVAAAISLVGQAPTEVRLVCFDDGVDGSELGRINEWLATSTSAPLQLVDVPQGGPELQSVGRARYAALGRFDVP